MSMTSHILIYVLSFLGVWVGSGLAIRAVERLSRNLRASQFAVSFLILGLFTSISELSVGINSIIEENPEIFVGNLIGASIVIFMLIIPLLAVTGKSIHITPEFQGFNLPASLVVISLPVVLVMDGKIGSVDSIIAISLFTLLVVSVQTKKGLLASLSRINSKTSDKVKRELLKIIFGLSTIFIASRFIVEQTLYFSDILSISPFLISLIFIAVGTNIPELSLVLRSAFMRSNQIAFGDYVGSATFNTFLLGFLTLLYGKPIILSNSYLVSLTFLIIGLITFYYFSRTKNTVTRKEGVILLILYGCFLVTEVALHKNLLFWL